MKDKTEKLGTDIITTKTTAKMDLDDHQQIQIGRKWWERSGEERVKGDWLLLEVTSHPFGGEYKNVILSLKKNEAKLLVKLLNETISKFNY